MSASIDKKKLMALFELPPNYTLEQLKASYRRLIIKYHPDKTKKVSDTPMFQMLTDCYRVLADNVKTTQKEHYQLKTNYKSSQPSTPLPQQPKTFNINMFNKLFDESKISDVHEDGYGDWAKSDKSFKERSKHALMVSEEPKPLISNADDIGYYEFGVKRVTDFSSQNRQLTDYRLAHTTDKIIELNNVKARRVYTSVQDLEQDRANISYNMTPDELAMYMQLKARQQKKEAAKVELQKRRDELHAQNHNRASIVFMNNLK